MRVAVVVGPFMSEQDELWRACSRLGVDITLVGTETNPYGARDLPWAIQRPSDLPNKALTPVRIGGTNSHLWWAYRGLGDAIRRLDPHVVHVATEPWGARLMQILALRGARRIFSKVVAHGADNIWWHGSAVEQQVRRLIVRVVVPRLDGFVSWNEEGCSLASDAGLSEAARSTVLPAVVPNPDRFPVIPDDECKRLRESMGLPANRVIVGFIGRLSPEKGVRDVLRVLDRLNEDAYVAMWGSGALEGEVTQRAASRKAAIGFLGPLLPAEVPRALAVCDIVVVPSRSTPELREQFGRIAVEAMLARRPVVAYETGALPSVIDDAGVLVAEGEVPRLAEAINELVHDAARRDSIANRGRRRALATYHPEVLARTLVAFWHDVVGQ